MSDVTLKIYTYIRTTEAYLFYKLINELKKDIGNKKHTR